MNDDQYDAPPGRAKSYGRGEHRLSPVLQNRIDVLEAALRVARADIVFWYYTVLDCCEMPLALEDRFAENKDDIDKALKS